jgi:triacylglycerol lipase
MRAPLLALLLAGCAPEADRCTELKGELQRCIGTRVARLDCSTVSEADVDRLLSFTQGSSCGLLASAAPVDGDLLSTTCRLFAVGCVHPVTPEPRRLPVRFPLLLVNGIDTSPLFRYSDRIERMMVEAGGHPVFLATLPPYEPTRVRTRVLWERVEEVRAQTGAAKVNLICHSLGGLDCRYLVSPNGLGADLGVADIAGKVASITTVGTAHRGTRIADVMLGLAPDGDQGRAVNDFAGVVGDWYSDEALREDTRLREAIGALTLAQAQAFAAEVKDAASVYYQSWAGYSRPFGEATGDHDARLRELCRPSDAADGDGLPGFGKHDFMALTLAPLTGVVGQEDDGFVPNDGLVTVASAKWGRFRGCIPADHMEQLGQRNIPDVNVQNGFDVARWYANVAGDLAERGF